MRVVHLAGFLIFFDLYLIALSSFFIWILWETGLFIFVNFEETWLDVELNQWLFVSVGKVINFSLAFLLFLTFFFWLILTNVLPGSLKLLWPDVGIEPSVARDTKSVFLFYNVLKASLFLNWSGNFSLISISSVLNELLILATNPLWSM